MLYSRVSFPAFEVSFFVSSVRLLTITEILFSSPCKIFIANIHFFYFCQRISFLENDDTWRIFCIFVCYRVRSFRTTRNYRSYE